MKNPHKPKQMKDKLQQMGLIYVNEIFETWLNSEIPSVTRRDSNWKPNFCKHRCIHPKNFEVLPRSYHPLQVTRFEVTAEVRDEFQKALHVSTRNKQNNIRKRA